MRFFLTVLFASCTSAAELELKWSPVVQTDYCQSLPVTLAGQKIMSPLNASDGYTCKRWLSFDQSFSPYNWVDIAQGRVVSPEPNIISGCLANDSSSCTGTIPLELSKYDSISILWSAGEDGSSFEFNPPIGSIGATFTLSSLSCTGDVLKSSGVANGLGGLCVPFEKPDEWFLTETSGASLELGKYKLRFRINLYSSRSAVTTRLNAFGIRCLINPSLLPAGCGNLQDWKFELSNDLTQTDFTSPSVYVPLAMREIAGQEGVTLVHPFNTSSLIVRVGLPVSEDPCNDRSDSFKCNIDKPVCKWDNTKCVIAAAPDILPTNKSLTFQDATIIFDLPNWGSGFERVVAYYWTHGPNETATPDPTVPERGDPHPVSFSCPVPCKLPRWSVEGVTTFKVIAHVEASVAGRFRAVFLSAISTRTYNISAPITPMPTPEPTAPPTPVPTPGAKTPQPTPMPTAPLTPQPASPITPVPTPMPTNRTAIPTAAPVTDGACAFYFKTEQDCTSPCSYDNQLQICQIDPPGPLIGTLAQRNCRKNGTVTDCLLREGELVPIAYNVAMKCTGCAVESVEEMRYLVCDYHNKTICNDQRGIKDFGTWNVYTPGITTIGMHLHHCDAGTDAQCGAVQILSVATINVRVDVLSEPRVLTKISSEQFAVEYVLDGVPVKPSSSGGTDVGPIIGLIIAIVCVIALAAGAAYLYIKKRESDREAALDDLDDDDTVDDSPSEWQMADESAVNCDYDKLEDKPSSEPIKSPKPAVVAEDELL